MRLPHLFPVAILALAAPLLCRSAAADDPPARTDRFTYRVTGLFSPEREKDLRAAFAELPGLSLVAIDFEFAEITVAFVPAKAFPGAKPQQVVEQFDQKLRSVTHHTFGVKPRSTVPREKLERVVIPTAVLDCKACCLAAYEAVAALDGVVQATASFKEGRVTALIDPTKTDRAKLEEALRKKGVQVGKP